MKFFAHKCIVFVLLSLILGMNSAVANIYIARDLETEKAIYTFNAPLIQVMHLAHLMVPRIIIDDTFNAFVSGNNKIYYMSGLLLGIDSVAQLMGVSAHELGHIKAKHLPFLAGAKRRYRNLLLRTVAIGLLVAATEKSQTTQMASAAGISLATDMATRQLLKTSRTVETIADTIAIDTLKKAKLNPIGLVQLQEKLLRRRGYTSQQQSYYQTHPTSESRLRMAKRALQLSPYKNRPYPQHWQKIFHRIQAKLFGFTKEKEQVFAKYPIADKSNDAVYARAVFYYAHHRPKQGITEIQLLLHRYPKDPYYNELYAQLLVNAGFVDKAIRAQEIAIRQYPRSGLLWMEYANILMKKKTKKALDQAQYSLLKARLYEPTSPYLYHLMVAYYSMTHQGGKRLLVRAEMALLNHSPQARFLAQQAKKYLKKGSAAYLRAQDIINLFKTKDTSGKRYLQGRP